MAARRAAAIEARSPSPSSRGALRWLRLATWLAPEFGSSHRRLIQLYRTLDDRWAAYHASRRAVVRFPHSADAWMLAGEAAELVFRKAEAMGNYEQALVIEERAEGGTALQADAAARYMQLFRELSNRAGTR
ncbi:MAG TPA: hypothetical protein VFD85_12395 [Gemmatimonadales bacterium]|nr:hypothetical protein [Gemmatimonadales bacterium]